MNDIGVEVADWDEMGNPSPSVYSVGFGRAGELESCDVDLLPAEKLLCTEDTDDTEDAEDEDVDVAVEEEEEDSGLADLFAAACAIFWRMEGVSALSDVLRRVVLSTPPSNV